MLNRVEVDCVELELISKPFKLADAITLYILLNRNEAST